MFNHLCFHPCSIYIITPFSRKLSIVLSKPEYPNFNTGVLHQEVFVSRLESIEMTMFLMSLLPERNQDFIQVQNKQERPENEFSSMIVNLAVPITLESSASSSSGYTWIKASIMNIICSNWRVCFKNCDWLVDVKGPKLPSPLSHSFRNKLETLQFGLCCPEVHF